MTDFWHVASARNGQPALVGGDLWRESRFAPDIDAERRVSEAAIEPGDTVLLLGMGAGTLPRAALAACGDSGRLVIAEPLGDVVQAVAKSGVSPFLFSDRRITVLTSTGGPDDPARAHDPARADDPAHANKNSVQFCSDVRSFYEVLSRVEADKFIVHPALELPPEFEGLKARIEDTEIRRRSWHRFSKEWKENLRRNRERFLKAPGVSEFGDILPQSDIIVAGGGPSLERLARAIGADANWIAVGTALSPLQLLGIDAALTVITDPQSSVAAQLAPAELHRCPPLVFFPGTAHAAVCAASSLVAAFPEGDGGRKMTALREEIGELPAGGTVTTTAIGLAVLMGARRIFLAGVDLAESRGQTHTRGTAREREDISALSRFRSREGGRASAAADADLSADALVGESVSGGKVTTRRNFAVYARAIEDLIARHADVEFIQLSESALKLRGAVFAHVGDFGFRKSSFSVPSGERIRKNGHLL